MLQKALSSSTSRLARDVFFPLVLTILDRCEDPHAIFHAINAITTLLQRLIDAEISRDDSFFALLRRVSQALLSRWDDINTTASTTREIACAFDALCDCAFGTDKKKLRPKRHALGSGNLSERIKSYFYRECEWWREEITVQTTLRARKTARITRIIMGMRTTILSDVLDVMSNDDSLGPSASWFLIELSKVIPRRRKIIFRSAGKDGGLTLCFHFLFSLTVRKGEALQRTLSRSLFKRSTVEILLLPRSSLEKF